MSYVPACVLLARRTDVRLPVGLPCAIAWALLALAGAVTGDAHVPRDRVLRDSNPRGQLSRPLAATCAVVPFVAAPGKRPIACILPCAACMSLASFTR